jgi:hypothetical protein
MKKKVKKYAEGGLAGLAETAESLMGEVDGMANNINYGSSTPGGSSQPLGMLGMKKGGSVNENKAMKKMGRGLTKAAMQKVASKVVKGHEKRMHKKYEGGGSVKMSSASKRADGCAQRGKTKGRVV